MADRQGHARPEAEGGDEANLAPDHGEGEVGDETGELVLPQEDEGEPEEGGAEAEGHEGGGDDDLLGWVGGGMGRCLSIPLFVCAYLSFCMYECNAPHPTSGFRPGRRCTTEVAILDRKMRPASCTFFCRVRGREGAKSMGGWGERGVVMREMGGVGGHR